jgi:mediator of RNA polymerase II transcription subunit 13
MTTKPHAAVHDITGSSVLAQFPPPISLSSSVLASVIQLPDNPLIAYAIFTGAPSTNAADHLNLIELARRKVLTQNGKRAVLDSLLPSVHITKDSVALYVFAFGTTDRVTESQAVLRALQFDGLSCE